ncbi:MAG TPA: MerR family transcriptional regulator [Symbiobacteriaceae bacterium]|nr:MerR family transcriptional regulator [Symbiobacteriaceae bacterium]
MKPLRTSDIAKAAGIHPNTVRKYEEAGFLPRPLRAPNGYRVFTERHVDQARLAVAFFRCAWLGEPFMLKAREIVLHAAAGDFTAALAGARTLLAQVIEERNRAELAAELLVSWAATSPAPDSREPGGMSIKEAAAYLHVTAHTLRNWDRNRLLAVPRDPVSGYRLYGPAELRRLMVIRALRQARYNLMSILNMFRQLEADPGIDPRVAIDSVPPGETDIYHSTYRWLTKVKVFEGLAHEALELLETVISRYAAK